MWVTLLRWLTGCTKPWSHPMTIDNHILANVVLARKTEKRLGEIAGWCGTMGHCCPSCASAEFRELSGKQERRLEWLTVLLRKRAEPDDLVLALDIDREEWP